MPKRAKGPPAVRPNDLALVAIGATIFLLALAALVAVGIASFVFGRGWVWPSGVGGAASVLGGLLTGHPGHGLAAPDRLPGTAVLWTVVVLVEIAALAVAIGITRWAAGALRPARSGSVTKAQAAAALGRRHRFVRRLLRRADEPAWPLGRSTRPRGVDLRVPFDRHVGVLGEATSDIVGNAALAAPGALLHVTSRPDDVLLTLAARCAGDRPVAVFDPRGLLPGLPSLVWDPLHDCVDAAVATRRAKAFAAGTVGAGGKRGDAARAATVLQCYFHAAALTGRTLDHVMEWVAAPTVSAEAVTILAEHPHAEPHWATLLRGATPPGAVARAMDAFLHSDITKRCLPAWRRPPTDVKELIARGGTVYVVGSDDPYATVSPLLTAVADDVLASGPPLAILDDVPALTPVPALPQRLSGRETCFVWTAPAQRQLVTCYGDDGAAAILACTDVLIQAGDEVTVTARPCPPIVARVRSAAEGRTADIEQARQRVAEPERPWYASRDPARSALNAAQEHGLHVDTWQRR